MPIPTNREYWNHNTAYHPWLIDIAAQHSGDVLDVGCGDGLLAQRLAPVSRSVTGIDPHSAAIQRADERLEPEKHFTVSQAGFDAYDAGPRPLRPDRVRRELASYGFVRPWKKHATS